MLPLFLLSLGDFICLIVASIGLCSMLEFSLYALVQTSHKPKKSKMVSMADLFDVLTLGKPSKGPIKITNTRASGTCLT